MLSNSSIHRRDIRIIKRRVGEMYIQQNMGYGNYNWISDELFEGPTES